MSQKPLVIADPFPQTWERIFTRDCLARLSEVASVVFPGDRKMSDAELDRYLPEAVAVVGQTPLPTERLTRAKKLRAVFNVEGNFYPNIDYDFCFREGIHVLCCGPAYAPAVAEFGLGLAIDLARSISREDRYFRSGSERYLFEANADSVLLSGSTVGLIGFGNLGRALRRLLEPFHCAVKVYDPWIPDRDLQEQRCEPADLDTLLSTCRFIFVLAGVTRENQGFLGGRELDLIRPGSFFILLSRAAVVDFEELTSRVSAGRFKAASDVFPSEPMPPDHPVRSIDDFILSPHRAGAIPQAFHAIGDMLVDDLELILRGLPPARMQRAQRETVMRFCSRPVA
jgi:phosphoglycerate dehydrogenase-like enzyme